MEEFDIDSDMMGTPINQLQNKPVDINNLIKDVEYDLSEQPKKLNIQKPQYNPKIDITPDIPIKIVEDKLTETFEETKPIVENIELMIFIVLFILLNNKFIIDIIENISFNNTNINLVIRGLLFGALIYYYKKYYINN
jgi:hypothetical protein